MHAWYDDDCVVFDTMGSDDRGTVDEGEGIGTRKQMTEILLF
jgi:hypothetical protein